MEELSSDEETEAPNDTHQARRVAKRNAVACMRGLGGLLI